ncbi:MAG: flagellar hook-basal body complex protein FliE [Phycisphaerae bacterium]|jgi:flagellar hook-basal body complex protein FliE
MINFDPNIASVNPSAGPQSIGSISSDKTEQFKKAVDSVKNQISNVDGMQKQADESIADLLTGKNQDITSVVSSVAKADMSFKLLVGVRNKLIEAYKQTMQMGI